MNADALRDESVGRAVEQHLDRRVPPPIEPISIVAIVIGHAGRARLCSLEG